MITGNTIKSDYISLDSYKSVITAGSIVIDGENNAFCISDKLVFSQDILSINGVIKSTSGTIGGWNIGTNSLHTTHITLNSTYGKITAGDITIDGKNNKFTIGNVLNFDGSNLSISGDVNASAGTIGGWKISTNVLESTNGSLQLDSNL
jgi:hypothetical protein